ISIQAPPFLRPARIPSGPAKTTSLTAGDGRQVMTASQPAARARGLSAQAAPCAIKGLAALRSRSCTVRANPWRNRLAARCPPRWPSPMKPYRILRSRVVGHLEMQPVSGIRVRERDLLVEFDPKTGL